MDVTAEVRGWSDARKEPQTKAIGGLLLEAGEAKKQVVP